jgi:hypothetical protein
MSVYGSRIRFAAPRALRHALLTPLAVIADRSLAAESRVESWLRARTRWFANRRGICSPAGLAHCGQPAPPHVLATEPSCGLRSSPPGGLPPGGLGPPPAGPAWPETMPRTWLFGGCLRATVRQCEATVFIDLSAVVWSV